MNKKSESTRIQSTRKIYEEFASFAENPRRDTFRRLVKDHFGEQDNLDFKADWIESSKLARHILGMANSQGGCLIFGMKENEDKTIEPIGLSDAKDQSDFSKQLKKFLPSYLLSSVVFLTFSFTESEYPKLIGKTFQVVVVYDQPEYLPFVCEGQSTETKEGDIFVRRRTDTVLANYEEVQRIINRRIETQYSTQDEMDLKKEFEELKILYSLIEKTTFTPLRALRSVTQMGYEEINSKYPSEDLEDFIVKMIEAKKARIRSMIE